MYPDKMPFVSELNDIKCSITILGWGWKGKNTSQRNIYEKNLTDQMLRFLEHIDQSESILGCRDWYTMRYLKNHGLKNLMMTGCPAWYDLDIIDSLEKPEYVLEKDNLKICISDAAFDKNKRMMKSLICFMREKFPNAKIQVVFHRGIVQADRDVIQEEFTKKYAVHCRVISGNVEGFEVYNDCDLHVGFRVHAHIYNLSRGNVSILLNEDARGYGVNDALGIQNVDIYTANRFANPSAEYMIKSIDDYLDYIQETSYRQYGTAVDNIQFYYENMQKFLHKLL